MFAGSVSVGACTVDQPVVAFLRHDRDVTVPPPVQFTDIEMLPPDEPSAPDVGVRVIEHPVGAFGGGAVPTPVQTRGTEAWPPPSALAVYTQLRPPDSLTVASSGLPVTTLGVVQSREACQATDPAAGEQATVSVATAPPAGLAGVALTAHVCVVWVQVSV